MMKKNKKLKDIFYIMVILILSLQTKSNALANIKMYEYETEEATISSAPLIEMSTISYAKPSPVYDFFDENNVYNVVYVSEENLYWSKFDDNMNMVNTIKIKMPDGYDKNTMPDVISDITSIFGNAVYYKGYLYAVYGRCASSTQAMDSLTEDTMIVVKYSKEGNAIAETKLAAAFNNWYTDWEDGVYLPFYTSSNCSLAINEEDDTMACFFQAHMYSNHQRAGLFFIDLNTMEWVSNSVDASDTNKQKYKNVVGGVTGPGYYSSHSLGQRIIATSDGGFLMADQNDSSRRGLTISKVFPDDNGNLQINSQKMIHFREGTKGNHGYNVTHLAMANIIELSDGYMFIGAMERTLSLEYSNTIDESWDIFVQKYDKNFTENSTPETLQMFNTSVREATGVKPENDEMGRLYLTGEEKDYGIKWLTDLKNENTIIQIRAVKLDNDNIAILYESYPLKESVVGGYSYGYNYVNGKGKVYYMIIDGDGNIVSNPTEISNVKLTQEEHFQYKNGKIYWSSTEHYGNSLVVNVLDVNNPINQKIGDINGDGKVNMKDWNRMYEHINETNLLTGDEFLCADINGDGKVNMKDWNRVYEHINETNPLY